jgi:hypothetical protein
MEDCKADDGVRSQVQEDDEALHQTLLALTAPPMEMWKAITPAAIMAMDLYAMYKLLPVLLGAIQFFARRSSKNRGKLVRTLRVLRSKLSTCRVLKFKFLSLAQNEGFKKFWNINVVYDPHCYDSPSNGFDEFALDKNDLDSPKRFDFQNPDDEKESLCKTKDVQTLARLCSKHGCPCTAKRAVNSLLKDMELLVYAAITEILHPTRGVRLKERSFRFRKYKETFHAQEAVDFCVTRLGLSSVERETAVKIMDRMREVGLIRRLGLRDAHFKDDNHLWVVNINRVHHDEIINIVTESGIKIACYNEAQLIPDSDLITQIELSLGADEIDLQNLRFWTEDIFNLKEVKQGDALAYRLIVHPLGDGGCVKELNELGNSTNSSFSGFSFESPARDESFDNAYIETESPSEKYGHSIVFAASVDKVFKSIARPFILSLRNPTTGVKKEDLSSWDKVGKRILVKSGDDLMQDYLVQVMFRLFNAIWMSSHDTFSNELVPCITVYEVFPTGQKNGILEVIEDVISLKDFHWQSWVKEVGTNRDKQRRMICSAAGSYIGAYVLGVRDRHWDNILVTEESTLLHIDFGFLMGQEPPIDAPRFSISPAMQMAFEKLGIWEEFLELCGRTFMVLHEQASRILRTLELIFPYAGFHEHILRKFISGPFSLNIHASKEQSVNHVISQVSTSASAWKTKMKSLFHNNIDPVFYSLLENKFPPAVLAMKIVDSKREAKGNNATKSRLQKITQDSNSSQNQNTFSVGLL